MPPGSSRSRRRKGLKRLLDGRGVMATDYDDWRKIEQTETANARPGSPREKFVRPADWLQALAGIALLAFLKTPLYLAAALAPAATENAIRGFRSGSSSAW